MLNTKLKIGHISSDQQQDKAVFFEGWVEWEMSVVDMKTKETVTASMISSLSVSTNYGCHFIF